MAEAIRSADHIKRMAEVDSDMALRYMKSAMSNPRTGVVIFGHLPNDVRTQLEADFYETLTDPVWLAGVVTVLHCLEPATPLPVLYRRCCTLAAMNAFLSYSGVAFGWNKENAPPSEDEDAEDAMQLAWLADKALTMEGSDGVAGPLHSVNPEDTVTLKFPDDGAIERQEGDIPPDDDVDVQMTFEDLGEPGPVSTPKPTPPRPRRKVHGKSKKRTKK